MMKLNFTSQELFCMALLLQKDILYGIPNDFETGSQIAIQSTLDALMEANVVHMDMDGCVFLDASYHNLVNTVCDSNKFLTVYRRNGNTCDRQTSFWSYAGRYLMADVFEAQYLFSWADEATIRSLLDDCVYQGERAEETVEIVIPQIQLVKALRLCQDDRANDAIRLLRQNGAPEEIAHVVLDGLRRESYFLEVKFADLSSGDSAVSELSFLASRGHLLSLRKTMLNLRSCKKLSAATTRDMHCAISQISNSFFAGHTKE